MPVHAAVLMLMLMVVANIWQVKDLPAPSATFDQPFIQVMLLPPPAPPCGVERQQTARPSTG